MQGDSSVLATSTPTTAVHDGGDDGGSNLGDDKNNRVDEGDPSCGANRWPRQETLALLKIRSDMDSVFRDSNLKGPLWEEVSRKLAELGYHRSAKKCKEKFENVHKYHKRTKEGRAGKSEGKTYRFFDQLEAFAFSHHPQSQPPPPPPAQAPAPPQQAPLAPPEITTTTLPWTNPPTISHATVPLPTTNHQTNNVVHVITPPTTTIDPHIISSPVPLSSSQPLTTFPTSLHNLTSHLFSSSTSSSTASDDEIQGTRKRKRKWKDFFERLTRYVIKKQEDLQRKFLEAIEKREQERISREESWRMQEMSRINREHEILIQERAAAAAKDSSIITFLQKISGQQNSIQNLEIPQPLPQLPPQQQPPALSPAPVTILTPAPVTTQPRPPPALAPVPIPLPKKDNNGQNSPVVPSPSRWPKVEVEALIKLRTNLDTKYQDNGPKGPLWEEISAGMQKLGYNRSAKRCKEKWENINKYFKKVKESNKKRPEDSKTCPYFHQLDALYKEKGKISDSNSNSVNVMSTMEPLMVRPEQQWPLQQQSHNLELNGREEDEDDDEDDEMETEEEDEGGGGFQVVASNKPTAE